MSIFKKINPTPIVNEVADKKENTDESQAARSMQPIISHHDETKDSSDTHDSNAITQEDADHPPMLTLGGFGSDEDGETTKIAAFAENAYLSYAMSMVKGRALPYCQDGQKPVQRRILFSMHQLGLTHTSKPVKSARVVGDVLGKFHPHGDSSAYEAAVRLSQGFKMRYPMIDGQGNFGSRDGDSAAAMRYTEMRLTKYSELLMSEINLGTVDFVANYDGAFTEPSLLPARLPIMLMNGAEGIAVGMSAKIPPHHLNEVSEAAILAIKQKADFDSVMACIQGPDFPEGGHIISSRAEILDAYRKGSGSVRIRCRWEIEHLARGQYRIVVTELPYDVSPKTILSEIDAISSPVIKAKKKTLDPEQIAMKQTLLSLLDFVRDESDKNIRIVIEPKTSKVDANDLMNFLLANTSLESSFAFNLTMVGLDGKPARKNIVNIIQEWADFRVETVTRRTHFLLNKCLARMHILEGRMIAFIHIDEVIRVIKESDEPKANLIEAFKLSEIQAEDILEIKLRQLARLEGIKIENEIKELKLEADRLQGLLANNHDMRSMIVKEIRDDMKRFGDERRTLVEPVERAKKSAISNLIPDEPVTVLISKQGWARQRLGHGLDLATVNHKPGDQAWIAIETNSTHPVIFIDNAGRSYSILAHQLPGGKGEGVPLSTLIDLQKDANGKLTKVIHAISGSLEDEFLFTMDDGYGFTAKLSGLVARNKAGKAFIDAGDSAILLPIKVANNDTFVAVSSEFKMLAFPLTEVKARPSGGKGVVLMDVGDQSQMTQVALTVANAANLQLTDKKAKVVNIGSEILVKYMGKRARKGLLLA